MKSVKALVIVMGLLIVAGLGLLVYGMANQISGVAGPDAPSGFDETIVSLPVGCSVIETRVDGDRLIVRTDGPLGYKSCRQIIIFDLLSGEVLGRITFAPQP